MPLPTYKKSIVWKFFDLDENRKFAVCRLCEKKYSFHGNTSNLKEHIRRVHPIQYQIEGDKTAGIASVVETQTPSTSNDLNHFEKTPSSSNDLNNLENLVIFCDVPQAQGVKRKRPRQLYESKQSKEIAPGEICSIDKAVKKSVVWKFFDLDENRKFALCRLCKKKYNFHGNTSNLKEHIRRVHPIQYQIEGDENAGIAPIIETQTPSTSNDLNNLEDLVIFCDVPQAQGVKRKQQRRLFGSKQSKELVPGEVCSIDEAVVAMIVKDYQPLSIVEDAGFRNLVRKLNSQYTLPSQKKLKQKLLPTFYNTLKEKLIRTLNSVDYISLTADYWKSNDNRNYISLTGHYILEDKLHSTNLSTREVKVIHSSTNIAAVIKDICNSFSIFPKIVTVVTDNAPNMIKAVFDLSKRHHPCVAHTINLTVNDALTKDSELTRLVTKCRALITNLRQSSAHSDKLREKQIELNLCELKLIQDIPTRWNSTYFMLQRLKTIEQPLSLAIADITSENSPGNLSGDEWAVLNDCLPILKPFLDVTEEMSGDKYVTMSTMIPLIRCLLHAVKSIVSATQTGRNLQKALLEIIQCRLGHLENNKTIAKATFLDPRFKKAGFAQDENAQNAQHWVIEELTDILQDQAANTESEQPEETNDPLATETSSNETVSVWTLFDSQVSQELHETPNTTAINMVKQYVEVNLLDRRCDPLEYWKNHAMIFPGLYQLAKKYLSIPASSVPSERIFSKTGDILSDRRNRLSSEKLEEIMFLNGNIELNS